MCKMIICLCVFFFIFSKFYFSELLVKWVWGKRAKNGPKCSIFQEQYIMIVMYGTCMYNDISWCFFHFFKILIFMVVRRVKGKKIVQNDKKFCLSCCISKEPYIIWLAFMVHLCKPIISPGVFFIFSKFWFCGLLVV